MRDCGRTAAEAVKAWEKLLEVEVIARSIRGTVLS
jgi:hypothetical protein